MKKNIFRTVLYFILIFVLIGVFFGGDGKELENQIPITPNKMEDILKENENKAVIYHYENGDVHIKVGEKLYTTQVNPKGSTLDELYDTYDVKYKYIEEKASLGEMFSAVLPIVIVFFVISLLINQSRANKAAQQVVKQESKTTKIPDVKMDEIGGIGEETRREVEQILDIFKNKEDARFLGIKPPTGAILYGPPGTGKTLLAKAIAQSLNANFYSVGGSSFMEMFVGVGAKRVRELFAEARKNTPALIFIDEIDAVAGKRGNSNRNEERENTLNELLKQLDGTEENENIFVIAATNRFDILDEALVRPGRFDYKIHIGLPDVEGRNEILKIHAKGKPLEDDVTTQIPYLAQSTTGFSGAELEALFMMAANNAFSLKRNTITLDDVNFALDRITLGNAGRRLNDKETKRRVAYHEAGHALVGIITKPGSVRKATIIPRGEALGYVAPLPKEMELATKSELMDRVKMILAGGVAERKKFGEHSVGVGGDVQQAAQLIERMVELGMKGDDYVLMFDEKEKKKEMQTIYDLALKECKEILEEYQDSFETLTNALLDKETLSGEEIESLLEIKKQPSV